MPLHFPSLRHDFSATPLSAAKLRCKMHIGSFISTHMAAAEAAICAYMPSPSRYFKMRIWTIYMLYHCKWNTCSGTAPVPPHRRRRTAWIHRCAPARSRRSRCRLAQRRSSCRTQARCCCRLSYSCGGPPAGSTSPITPQSVIIYIYIFINLFIRARHPALRRRSALNFLNMRLEPLKLHKLHSFCELCIASMRVLVTGSLTFGDDSLSHPLIS